MAPANYACSKTPSKACCAVVILQSTSPGGQQQYVHVLRVRALEQVVRGTEIGGRSKSQEGKRAPPFRTRQHKDTALGSESELVTGFAKTLAAV